MAEKPALTLLHLGPGFANGIANLHNARRARSPIVNLIGDHTTWHVGADSPLTSDIVSLATPVSGWVRSVVNSGSLAGGTAEAIAAAGNAPGQIATLIIPADCQWDPAGSPAAPLAPPQLSTVSSNAIKLATESIRRGKRVALFIGGTALRARGLKAGCANYLQDGLPIDLRNFSGATRERCGDTAARSIAVFS